jgi:hypothetical protein
MQVARLRIAHILTMAMLAIALLVFPFSGMHAMGVASAKVTVGVVDNHQHADASAVHVHDQATPETKGKLGCDGTSHYDGDGSCCGFACHSAVLSLAAIAQREIGTMTIADSAVDSSVLQMRPDGLDRPPRAI